MTLPEDVAGIQHEWIRQSSHGWTERTLRDTLVRFLDSFQDSYAWVVRMKLEEKFTDTGVGARVPIGPTGPEQREDNFLQRDGIPTIIITAIRGRDNREFEVGLPFTLANDTPGEVTRSLLLSALSSLIVAERNSRGN